jgi:uncharacterized membrane protein YcaP (DUF421 family)
MTKHFFSSWSVLGRTALFAAIGYLALLVLLRIAGKRALATMNIFDFILSVAIGETLADAILTPDLDLASGITAAAVLVGLQLAIARLTTRSQRLEELVNGSPVLLFHHGEFLRGVMRRERITEEEVRAAVREEGVARLEDVGAVVLETDGGFSVLHGGSPGHPSSLDDVEGYPPEAARPAPAARSASPA